MFLGTRGLTYALGCSDWRGLLLWDLIANGLAPIGLCNPELLEATAGVNAGSVTDLKPQVWRALARMTQQLRVTPAVTMACVHMVYHSLPCNEVCFCYLRHLCLLLPLPGHSMESLNCPPATHCLPFTLPAQPALLSMKIKSNQRKGHWVKPLPGSKFATSGA